MTTNGLRPYPAYRDSAADWLGRVPEHWEVRRLKTLADMQSGDAITAMSIDEAGQHPVYGANGLRGYTSSYTHDGDFVLIGRQGALCGNVHLAHGRFWASEHAVVATLHLGHVPYWFGALLRVMNLNQYSIAAAQPGLSVDRILNLWAPVPPKLQQTAIARFLNHADRRIRRYIRAKERLIELLEERKRALIHEAVTGRIDVRTGQPHPAYKDSGVEWLGKVPEHWEVRRNVWLFRERNETGFGSLPVLEVSLLEGVRIRDMDHGQRKQQIVDRSQYKRARRGDIAYNTMRMWQGAVGVVPVDGLVSPAYVVADPVECMESRYYGYLFRTRAYKHAVKLFSRGIVSDRDRLYWDDFKRLASLVPPPLEETGIVGFLDLAVQRIQAAISATQRQIELVREYRTRLIADVVTGKLDVREAAVRPPPSTSFPPEGSGRVPRDTLDANPTAPSACGSHGIAMSNR